MKIFTNTFLFTILFSLTLSCSSDDDNGSSDPQTPESDFYIKAKVDGEESIFNRENFISAQMSSFAINGFYFLSVEGSAFDDSNQGINETISIGLNSENPIAIGTYDQPELLPFGLKHAFIGYTNADLDDQTGFVTDINDPVSSLEITELTENTIKGKFSGILQSPTIDGDITISEGEFFLELNIEDD